MQEEWRDIKGYEGLYQVSNLGQVRNKEGKILKSNVRNRLGHTCYFFKLSINSRRKNFFAHRLVAQAFLPNPNNQPCVDHVDRNPFNNCSLNLRWASHSENQRNRRKQINKSSSYKGVSKLKTKEEKWLSRLSLSGKTFRLGQFYCQHAAARKYNQAAIFHFDDYAYLNNVQDCNCDECKDLKDPKNINTNIVQRVWGQND